MAVAGPGGGAILVAPALPPAPATAVVPLPFPLPANPFSGVSGLLGSSLAAQLGGLLRTLVADFTTGLAQPLARYLLHTPDLAAEGSLHRLWLVLLGCLGGLAALLVAISGTALATGTGRLGLAAREAVGTRLAGSLLTAAVSLPLVALEAQLANRLVDAIIPAGFAAAADPLWAALRGAVAGQPTASLALLAVAAVAVVLLVALTVLAMARWATLWLLIVLAPVAMGFALLPTGADVARLWWRLQLAAVFLPVAHAVLLAGYVAMFASAGHGLLGALSGVAVLVLMTKLPAWAAGLAVGVELRDFTSPWRRRYVRRSLLKARSAS